MKRIKTFKKIFAMALAMMMMLAMTVPALADEAGSAEQTFSITITNAVGTYKAYQVFKGKLSEDKTVLSDIEWGSGVNAFKYSIGEGETTEDAKKIAKFLAGKNESAAKAFAETAAEHVIKDSESQSADAVNETAELKDLPAGYYIILNSNVGSEKAVSSFILQVTANQKVKNKADVPSFEKKLKDINDTNDSKYTGWQDSADYDIGDKIPFKLEGTVASNYADYKNAYRFVFHDQEEDGLTFDPKSVKVYVDNTAIANTETATYYQVITEELGDSCTFEIQFPNLKNIESVQAGSKIRVEYESELNDKAVLGNQGNVNKAKLEFSNNPNEETTSETPWDSVIAFTYQIVVNKYANEAVEANRLAGAEFSLQKKLEDGTTKEIAVVKSEDGKIFTFKGLDDGTYILTETKTPDGYNKISPITFTVTAEHTATWETGERTGILTSLSGNAEDGSITFAASDNKSELTTDVINNSGATLPETGGIGTKIFYLVGGILAVGAAVLLIVKRRMSR